VESLELLAKENSNKLIKETKERKALRKRLGMSHEKKKRCTKRKRDKRNTLEK
jgi:hypothetical protein